MRSSLRHLAQLTIALGTTVLLGACGPTPEPPPRNDIVALDVLIDSRDTRIPATLTTPKSNPESTTEELPLVVMLHGHGGDRHEASGFTQIAERLAGAGIASIRMDFAGCGDSTEPFRNNHITSMLADARAARDYALNSINVDTTRMAIMGFSMGGRLAVTLAHEDPRFQALALWAPSVDAGTTGLVDFLGGTEALAKAKATATANGFVPFTTSWGQQQELSAGWFADMEASRPLDLIPSFTGALYVLYGDQDTVVPPAEAERLISAATQSRNARSYAVAGADHGLGLFSDEPKLTEQAVGRTVAALVADLRAP